MKAEDKILDELKLVLKKAGVSPLPANDYLNERISQRWMFFQNPGASRAKSELDPDSFSSPVCFVASDEVQSSYSFDLSSVSIIDKYIDQLISKKR